MRESCLVQTSGLIPRAEPVYSGPKSRRQHWGSQGSGWIQGGALAGSAAADNQLPCPCGQGSVEGKMGKIFESMEVAKLESRNFKTGKKKN